MERNWLIRTSQNQILGPVAKQKLLEFIQKGALGLTDEVTSGNGYWFQLREKELVEKYLYGDLPQGYNPISESKSVLAKREKPDNTSSINFSPANKTQSTKVDPANLASPKSEDLEFPDVTLIGKMPDLSSLKSPTPTSAKQDEVKLPNNDDLEFPDIGLIQTNVRQSTNHSQGTAVESTQFISMAIPKPPPPREETKAPVSISTTDDEIHYPADDDLEFPEIDSKKSESTMLTSPKVEKGKVDLNHQYTRTVALDNQQMQTDLPKVLGESSGANVKNGEHEDDWEFDVNVTDVPTQKAVTPSQVVTEVDVPHVTEDKKAKPSSSSGDFEFDDIGESETPKTKKVEKGISSKQAPEEKKLLFERKVKTSKTPASQRDPEREIQAKKTQHIGEPLKKRNDNYLFFILIIIILIIVAVFFYFKEILNKPLPV